KAVIVPDVTDEDALSVVAMAARTLAERSGIFIAAASGFIKAYVRSVYSFQTLKKPGAPILVVGSVNPVTRAQVNHAINNVPENKRTLVVIDPAHLNHPTERQAEIARVRGEILQSLEQNKAVIFTTKIDADIIDR